MNGKARLLSLLARRERQRAAVAAAAAAAAQHKADAASALETRLASVLQAPTAQSIQSAADLQNRQRLLQDVAAERERQRDRMIVETQLAAEHRLVLSRHTLRHERLCEAADQARADETAEREARSLSSLPERKAGQ